MIVTYAQATERQGVDAAMSGKAVASDDARFLALREKAVALNLASRAHRQGDVEVRYGKGIVRMEMPGGQQGTETASPIVVVADGAELRGDGRDFLRTVTDSLAAMGREGDSASIQGAFDLGAGLHRAALVRRRIATVVVVVLVTVAAVWLVRSCASAAQLPTSAGQWSR